MDLPNLKQYSYDVLNVLSDSGGFAKVYWAIDNKTGNQVAIKEPRRPTPAQLKALEKEAQMYLFLSQKNEHITKLKDFIKMPNQDYLVMEFIDGWTLEEYQRKVAKGPISDRIVVPVFLQILDAVGYIHRNGFVHKDIKPANIMVRKADMKVKMLDMGISAKLKDINNNARAIGTPAFMPPEQFQKEQCGPYTDIFALGVTLFSLLTYSLPFNGATTTEIWNKIKLGRIPNAHQVCPFVNPEFQPIIEKSLRPEPWLRYQTCAEMAKAIKKIKL
ncbi:MAG: serine/threonine protein kinase [Bacteroidales bacterium]|nr:serine/threonine protein kinase [Bacteroidales bacterium]